MTGSENKKLNVCLMNDSFPPLIDGVAMTVLNYANILTSKGEGAIVAAPKLRHAADDYPFPVIRYQSVDFRKQIGYTVGNPFSLHALKKITDMRPNILHSHCPLASSMLARNLKQTTGAPMILTYHSKFDVDFAKFLKHKLPLESAIKFLVDNVRACDEIWTVSEGAGENLRSLGYQGAYIVMPNGVDMPKGKAPDNAVAALRERYEIREDVPLLLFVGRMMWYKGVKTILDSLRTLKDEGARFRMMFAGGDGDIEEIKKYAADLGLNESECTFLGPVRDREVIRALYSCGYLFLFPSTYDTNGLVVREAAASGLASVLIKGSCAAEGITDGETGFLIDENTEAMTAALRRCLAAPELVRHVGENACGKIYISWEDSVSRATDRYHILLEKQAEGELERRRLKTDKIFDIPGNIVQLLEKLSKIKSE